MLATTTRKRNAFPVNALPLLVETMHKDEHIYEWGKSLIGLDVTMSDMGKATGVQVISHDRMTGESFMGECKLENVKLKIGGTNDWRSVYAGVARDSIQTVVDPNVQDRTEAEEVAEAILREKSFDFIKGYGEAEGDAGLKAGAVVTIKYAGLRYDGEYIAEEVEHKLSMKGGYTTGFDIRRNMIGDEAVKELGGSRAVGPSPTPPPREKPESEQITVYEDEEEEHGPLLKEILSVACYDRDGNETAICSGGKPLVLEAVCNASVEEGTAVTLEIYREGATPGQDEPVETLTADVRQNRARAELDAEAVGRLIGTVIGGVAGGAVGARIGREIGRFFVRASSEGCEEVQSECVEIEPARVELLTTAQVNSNWGRRYRVVPLTDINTGQTFNISWNFYSRHTDWSPMTSDDTAIIKSILRPGVAANDPSWANTSSWSWTGRPGIIAIEGRRIAVGFHLSPHGSIIGGAQPGWPLSNQSDDAPTGNNQWPLGGHMCMYYGDSTGGGNQNRVNQTNDAARDAYNRSF